MSQIVKVVFDNLADVKSDKLVEVEVPLTENLYRDLSEIGRRARRAANEFKKRFGIN